MITFIRGTVYSFTADHVVIDNNGIGYYINFMHPEVLTLGETITIFTYQHFREDATVLYGFVSQEELDLFMQLITVKGMGPKTSLVMLGNCKLNELINAIENGKVEYLKSIPSVGQKTAQQIILDLKGKLVGDGAESADNEYVEEAILGLKALGYKGYEIAAVTGELNKMKLNSSDEYLKAGLKLLMKVRGL